MTGAYVVSEWDYGGMSPRGPSQRWSVRDLLVGTPEAFALFLKKDPKYSKFIPGETPLEGQLDGRKIKFERVEKVTYMPDVRIPPAPGVPSPIGRTPLENPTKKFVYFVREGRNGPVIEVLIGTPVALRSFLKTDPVYSVMQNADPTRNMDERVERLVKQGITLYKVTVEKDGRQIEISIHNMSSIGIDANKLNDMGVALKRSIGEVAVKKGIPVGSQQTIRSMLGVGRRRRKTRKTRRRVKQ